MHKGYVRRTIFLWGSALIWVLIGVFFFSGTVKGYMGGESLYKAGDIYHLNDAGTSVAISCVGYRFRGPHLRWKRILLNKA